MTRYSKGVIDQSDYRIFKNTAIWLVNHHFQKKKSSKNDPPIRWGGNAYVIIICSEKIRLTDWSLQIFSSDFHSHISQNFTNETSKLVLSN